MNAVPRRRQLAAGAAAVGVLAAGGAAIGWRRGWFGNPRVPQLRAGQALQAAQLDELARVPDFTLDGAAGPFTRGDLEGRWTYVFFGYTNCPDACPITLAVLNHAQAALRAQGLTPPRIVFVSLDPQRDTPAVLQRYGAAFGADTVGVTGTATALQGLLTFFGVTVERRPGPDAWSYTLDHTTNFFLLRPDGRWLATFAAGADGAAVLADTATLMRLPMD